ncbi:type II toxin-antitoxin system VapC family toxin [Fimbriiglobus ruber]|uniref:type II toxin-antitoxin system VapC family toxin n=1 Tax=Fimbriiglobus ruber TaxID=1908690 RepID=UPI000B4B2F0C|nr:type II toxin-antitoxin system VapC family toxin [Fimbriiglobus ruber]
MRLLLDTCALLWLLGNDRKLSVTARSALLDPANERWLSPISLLEIALKVRLGKLPLPKAYADLFPAELIGNDIHLVPLEPDHMEPLTTLPLHHKDPFDRLIASTALVEGLTLVSADLAFDAYGINRIW